jgi:alanine dehydrogenase
MGRPTGSSRRCRKSPVALRRKSVLMRLKRRQASLEVLRRLATQFNGRVRTIFSTRAAIADLVTKADLVIGAVLVPGASAPKLITRTMIKTMKQGSVFVDIAIDQGGCAETSRPTTHSNPTFVVDGVVHYCVANMPGAVARTSTFALNNATLPFTLQLADKGWRQALKDDIHLRNGLNVCDGKITCKPVADAHGLGFTPAEALID